MSTDAISPLRRRMIEDMSARKLNPHTQRSHIGSCKRFAAYLNVMIELKLSTTTQRRPFLPFLPLTVSQRRRLWLAEPAPTSCNRRRRPEPIPTPAAHAPPDSSARQVGVCWKFRPREIKPCH